MSMELLLPSDSRYEQFQSAALGSVSKRRPPGADNGECMMTTRNPAIPLLLAFGTSLTAGPIYADAIIDPFNQGDTVVYSLSDNQDSQFRVGGYGGDGAFELNSETQINGITSLTRTALNIGGNGESGQVRVVGDGNAGSAQFNITSAFGSRFYDGSIEILDGGVVQSGDTFYIGVQGLEAAPVDFLTVVDGAGSLLQTQQSSVGETWERDGGRIYVGFDGQSSNTLNIMNGGTVEALSGRVGDSGDDGSIWLGVSNDEGSDVTVNVNGAGSVLRADHYIEIGNRLEVNTSALMNVTDGATVEVLSAIDDYPGALVISDTVGQAEVFVSGGSQGDSTVKAETIMLGGRGLVRGFTSGGDPVSYSRVDSNNFVDGQQIQDIDGNLLYDQNGLPILANEEEVAPGFFFTSADPVYVKNKGMLTVENGGKVEVSGDIHVSTPTYDPDVDQNLVSLIEGQQSSLTVRSGGTINATNVIVNEDGLLTGDGGVINSNVVVDGGTLSPGDSPGTMTILGDLIMEGGVLDLEFDPFGTSDLLNVSGDAFFGSDSLINFILYDQFNGTLDFSDFLVVGGMTSFGDDFSATENFSFDFFGDTPANVMFDFLFQNEIYEYKNGTLSLADSSGVPVNEPPVLWLLMIGLVGLLIRKAPAWRLGARFTQAQGRETVQAC